LTKQKRLPNENFKETKEASVPLIYKVAASATESKEVEGDYAQKPNDALDDYIKNVKEKTAN
jgi:hypothetical protein